MLQLIIFAPWLYARWYGFLALLFSTYTWFQTPGAPVGLGLAVSLTFAAVVTFLWSLALSWGLREAMASKLLERFKVSIAQTSENERVTVYAVRSETLSAEVFVQMTQVSSSDKATSVYRGRLLRKAFVELTLLP